MSHYCWEHGEIRLPSTAVVPMKKALRDSANAHHKAVLDLCKQVWQGPLGRTRSNRKYDERLQAWYNDILRVPGYSNAYSGRNASQVQEDAYNVLRWIVQPSWGQTATPRQATVADVQRVAPKYTNRNATFLLGEASVTFNGNTVIWDVPENNHADEWARRHPLAEVFFRQLERVKWTRGSGGEIVGNDEYNRDADYAGGGANYTVAYYGPRSGARTPGFRTQDDRDQVVEMWRARGLKCLQVAEGNF